MQLNSPPRAKSEVSGPHRVELVLDDGVVLVADLYRPTDTADYPVLLMRQPYGRAIASTLVLAHPAWYAAHGYVVICQDVRGTGGSGGIYDAFVNEARDGAQTLDWAATLQGTTGKVGLYGFSYQAVTQYLAIAGGGKRPDAISPSMGGWDLRDDWAFEGGAFRSALALGWATQMAMLQAARAGDSAAIATLGAPATAEVRRTQLLAWPQYSHFPQWAGDTPEYWSSISPHKLLANDPLDIPALHVGGWADFLLNGTVNADAAFRAKTPQSTHLIVGPWAHHPWNRASGAADMGENAAISIDRAHLAFFDFYLKNLGDRTTAIALFDMGTRQWRHWPAQPATTERTLFLASSGLAATTVADGLLGDAPAPADIDYFVHDPGRPTPLIGGHHGTPQGFVDRRATDDRADVAVYTTPPFVAPQTLVGPVAVQLFVESQSASFDLAASLSLVMPDGRALVLCTRHMRGDQSNSLPLTLKLGPVCVTIAPGQALRLSLQGAAGGAFAVNPGIGDIADQTPRSACQTITLKIAHGAETPSCLVLPILSEETDLAR